MSVWAIIAPCPRVYMVEKPSSPIGVSCHWTPKPVLLSVEPASICSAEYAVVAGMATICYDGTSPTTQQRRQRGKRHGSEPIHHSASGNGVPLAQAGDGRLNGRAVVLS